MRGTKAKRLRQQEGVRCPGRKNGGGPRQPREPVSHDVPWTTKEAKWNRLKAKIKLAPEGEHGKLKPVAPKGIVTTETQFDEWVAKMDPTALRRRLMAETKDFLKDVLTRKGKFYSDRWKKAQLVDMLMEIANG